MKKISEIKEQDGRLIAVYIDGSYKYLLVENLNRRLAGITEANFRNTGMALKAVFKMKKHGANL